MEDINRRIKSQLALRGMTQGDLAELLGVAEKTVSMKLTGQAPWKDVELIMLSKEFSVSVDYLLIGGDNNGEL